MSASPIYVWQQPIGWPTPQSLEDLGNQVQKLEVQAQGENARFVTFAESLMMRYPPGRPIGDLDPPWEQSVVPDAMASRRCVFKLEPPAGDVDLVEVLRDVVLEASKLGLTVLHEMSGLGFLPDGRVIPASEQGMWEGAKAHVKSGAPKKFTGAQALKTIIAGVAPAAQRFGFKQHKTGDKFNPVEWNHEDGDFKRTFLLSIDRYHEAVRLGGVVRLTSPTIDELGKNLGVGVSRCHLVSLRSLDRVIDLRKVSAGYVVESAADCAHFLQLVSNEMLPWLNSVRTFTDLDKAVYPDDSAENNHLAYPQAFFYLVLAYFARNPNLEEIQNSWINRAASGVHNDPREIQLAINYIQANPLPAA